MSKANTRATINANIKTNGNQEITGQVLNSVLNTMVDDYATQEEVNVLDRKIGESLSDLTYDIDTSKDIVGGGYWNDRGEVVPERFTNRGMLDVSKMVGAKAKLHFGYQYDMRMVSNCFIHMQDDTYVAISSLPDVALITGASASLNVVTFTIPENAIELLYCYSNNQAYIPRYGSIESAYIERFNGIVGKVASLEKEVDVNYNISRFLFRDFVRTFTSSESGDILFTINEAKVGDIIAYDITATAGYVGRIQLLDATGSVLAQYGKLGSGPGATHFKGTFAIPHGFVKCIVNGTNNVTISQLEKYIEKGTEYVINNNTIIPVADVCAMGEKAYLIVENQSDKCLGFGYSVHLFTPALYKVIDSELNTILPRQRQIIPFYRKRSDVDYLYFYLTDTSASVKLVISKSCPLDDCSYIGSFFPNIGSGQKFISRSFDTYAHGSYVFNDRDKCVVLAQTSGVTTKESGSDIFDTTLYLVNKINGSVTSEMITSDILENMSYNGNKLTKIYNISAILEGDILSVSFGAHCDNKLMLFLLTYNIKTGVKSDVQPLNLKYNGNSVLWTWKNYKSMVNTLYGYTFNVTTEERYSTDNGQMRKYNGKYYKIFAGQCGTDAEMPTMNVPWILMTSDDLLTWEVKARLNLAQQAAECMFSIYDDKIYLAARVVNTGTWFSVYDINGNILKESTQLDVISSKPTTFVYQGRVFLAYNANTSNVLQGKRTKIRIVEVNQNSYTLTEKIVHFDQIGYQYFDVDVYNQSIMMVNTANVRTHNDDANYGSTGGVTMMNIPLE